MVSCGWFATSLSWMAGIGATSRPMLARSLAPGRNGAVIPVAPFCLWSQQHTAPTGDDRRAEPAARPRLPKCYHSGNETEGKAMRARIGFVLCAALLLAPFGAQAQSYPVKPIRAIIPFPAGSATDGMARLVSAHFTKVFGHGLII